MRSAGAEQEIPFFFDLAVVSPSLVAAGGGDGYDAFGVAAREEMHKKMQSV